MRGRAADDFERTRVPQLSERREQIAVPFIDKKTSTCRKQFEVKFRQLGELRLIAVSFSFARGQVNKKIEMPDVALTQKFVLQHRAERRCERHRELERNVVVHEPLHHLQQRNVGFGDRLEETVFLEKMLVLRMPDERQVRVKNEREVIHTESGNRKPETGKQKITVPAIRNPVLLERPAKILQPIETFLNDVDAGRVAEPNGAIIAKGRA